jgi:hypothetical protein
MNTKTNILASVALATHHGADFRHAEHHARHPLCQAR